MLKILGSLLFFIRIIGVMTPTLIRRRSAILSGLAGGAILLAHFVWQDGAYAQPSSRIVSAASAATKELLISFKGNPFSRAPDDVIPALNVALAKAGQPAFSKTKCTTREATRSCEAETDSLGVSVTGTMGRSDETEKVLLVGNLNRDFLAAVRSLISLYAPNEDTEKILEHIAASLRNGERKGSLTIGSTYFSLMRVGGNVHFHVMRE